MFQIFGDLDIRKTDRIDAFIQEENPFTLLDPGEGGALGVDLPPSSSIEEENVFFRQLYLGNWVTEIPKLGHKLMIS